MAKSQTVLLTGISGYIAKHIAVRLLNAGFNVVGSLRSLSRADEIRSAVGPHLADPSNLKARLRFVALDLDNDDGWDAAMAGVNILMHTASPFPLRQPRDENELIRPAVDGTLRALRAANRAGIRRVVLTSSFAAVMDAHLPKGRTVYDESDWSDPTSPTIGAYNKSKTMAELAAWGFVKNGTADMALTAVNPTMVLGKPLDLNFGGSVQVVQRLLRGKDPMLPNYGLTCVDVGDVAEIHVRALSTPQTEGKRIIAGDRFMWFQEMAKVLKTRFPDRKIVTRRAPDFLIHLLGKFDPAIRQVGPHLGMRFDISNSRATKLLGLEFIPAEQSLIETAEFLVDNGLVD